MQTTYDFDYLLCGATGQIGRYLLPELAKLGTVGVVTRRLCYVDLDAATDVIVINDLETDGLPRAKHIVNAAGVTALAGPVKHLWKGNIKIATRLAHHAKDTSAILHQLSSVAVAEFRTQPLYEVDSPGPDVRQLDYSLSKVLLELSVRAILSPYQGRIYRIGDVVPPYCDLGEQWRHNHWLSILYQQGQEGFRYAPDDYSVWLASVEEVARGICTLLTGPTPTVHLLGHRYSWQMLRQYAVDLPRNPLRTRMSKTWTDIILHGPEARMVDQTQTLAQLQHKGGFEWSYLGETYWRQFAERSMSKWNR